MKNFEVSNVERIDALQKEASALFNEGKITEAMALVKSDAAFVWFTDQPKWAQNMIREQHEANLKFAPMKNWQTKILSLASEDEADPKTACFRPLGNGTVRFWYSQSYPSQWAADRDYNPAKDNYDGWYYEREGLPQGDNSKVLPVEEARKLWVELTQKVWYEDKEERIPYATPVWKHVNLLWE